VRRTVWFVVQFFHVVLYIVLTVAVIFAWRWTRRETPLIHDVLWNTAAETYVVKENSNREFTEVEKATTAVKNLADHTDITLNGPKGHPGLIPQLTMLVAKGQTAMDDLDKGIRDLDDVTVSARQEIDEIGLATRELTLVETHLDSLVTDPHIREELSELVDVTKDIDADVKQANTLLVSTTATAEDVRAVADDLRAKYLKARNLYYAIAKELLGLGSEGMQFFLKK
jgi:hypothetical protein